jgi:hypothetical protein
MRTPSGPSFAAGASHHPESASVSIVGQSRRKTTAAASLVILGQLVSEAPIGAGKAKNDTAEA